VRSLLPPPLRHHYHPGPRFAITVTIITPTTPILPPRPSPPPHRHQRNGSTAQVCQLRRPSSFLLDCQEASESVSERASATESLLSFPSSTVRECCQRASASGHRTYVLWLGSSARPLCCGDKDFASRPFNTVWLKTQT
jgi:hypothetical protein